MNIVNKLTLRHLKENKGRTIVTTLGICVSVAMITAVFVALASFLNLFGELEMITNGRYQAELFGISCEQLTKLEKDERISQIGLYCPDESSFLITDRKNDRVGTVDMRVGNKTYIEQMLTVGYDGRIPENENEIAIEQKLLDRNGLSLKLGDKIKLSEGKRYIEADGEEYSLYNTNYSKDESFRSSGEKEYTITAILHDNPATRFTPIMRGFAADEKSDTVNATIALSKVNYKSLDDIYEIINKYKIESYNINTAYLDMHFAFDENNELMASLLSVTAIILLIIIIASVVLIYNAFAMSISERVRYLGMLASVGATRKQKRLSVYFESFILGAFGIPIGVLAGIVGIGITLKAIGGRIISSGMITGVSDTDMQMEIVVPIWVIVGVILVSAFTIFISSYIPARKASKITPIDAIRQRNEIKIRARKLRSSKLVKAVFGYEGELANKNMKRNGRKSRVITASIALSVILFLCCNYFCDMFTQAVNTESDIPYQVQIFVDYGDRERLFTKLEEMNDVDSFYSIENRNTTIDKAFISDYDIARSENLTYTYRSLFDNEVMLNLNMLDDKQFTELCEANGIDHSEYYNDEYKALLLNNVSRKGGGSKVFTDKVIGADLSGVFGSDSGKLTIGALVDFDSEQQPLRLNPKNTIALYVPMSQYIKFNYDSLYEIDEETGEHYFSYSIGVETKKHSEVSEELMDYFSTEYFETGYVNDIADQLQTMLTISFVIQVLVYGFIALISLITIFNIINTISTGVAMRKKEFAMLKSVGTTPKGFNKMIMLESAFYGIKALIFAIPISIALSFGMYASMHTGSTIAFDINIPLYLGVIAVVMTVIGATMLYSVRKLRNDSIVETLKEEIN